MNKVLSFHDAVQRRTDKVNKTAALTVQKVGNVIKIVHEKTLGVKEDIKDGAQGIKQDVHNTTGHIADEFDDL